MHEKRRTLALVLARPAHEAVGSQSGTKGTSGNEPRVSPLGSPGRIAAVRSQYLRHVMEGLTPAEARRAIASGNRIALAMRIMRGELTTLEGMREASALADAEWGVA